MSSRKVTTPVLGNLPYNGSIVLARGFWNNLSCGEEVKQRFVELAFNPYFVAKVPWRNG